MSKALVVGLDCASPRLLFDEFIDELPTIQGLMDNAKYGELRSCDPPITIPAWAVMFTSRSPGSLGLYGFRHRKDNSYTDIWIGNSLSVKKPTLWEVVAHAKKKSCVVGATPTYPPKPLNGWLISGFLTPDASKEYTYPTLLKKEIEGMIGEYLFDVVFRTEDKDKLLHDLYDMTERRYKVVKYLLANKPWDLLVWVEIGLDRIHHGFWKYWDKEHHLHEEGNQYQWVIRDYYKYLDTKLGELLKIIDKDTVVFLVSDHGAKRMKGCVCINELLIREGYLKLKRKPKKICRIQQAEVDWDATKAWGWGGYYGRIFLNVESREVHGKIKPKDYEDMRVEVAEIIKGLRDPEGKKMQTKVYKPRELYRECVGDPPDLMVYFDNLSWRSAGTVGWDSLYLPENDLGPDDAVHAQEGILLVHDPEGRIETRRIKADILDAAPTILTAMGLQPLDTMEGKVSQ